VSLSVDGVLISTVSSSPYSFSWNTANVADGNHSVTATAKDAAGNTSASTITVAKNTTITTLPPSALPASVSLIMPPVQNQGGEGICAPFATAYAARSAEQFYRTNASSYSYSTNIFSPEFVYDQIKTSDCGSGTGVTTSLDFLMSTGVCTWQSMPYSSSNGCSLLPTPSQLSEAANFKMASYSKIVTSDITAIKTMVVNKHPVIITIATDQSFWDAQAGFIWKTYSGTPGISHSLVISGYDDTKHAYKVMNSWGTTWGDAGYSWIDYDFLPQASFYYSYVIN
jgi:C1A family cysteine protease